MKKNRSVVEQMFNVGDESFVSRPALKARIVRQDSIIQYLYEELFFADPYHSAFKGMPESYMAPLRTKAIVRKAVGYGKN
jgi:hypothetical protein